MLVEVFKNGSSTEHNADLVMPIGSEGSVMIQLKGDSRPISRIAEDFEDPDEIRTEDGRSYTEYTEPIVVYRMDPNTVQVRIKREG